jgi:TolB-like protein/class 3 adenylate cyclase/Flp pilus assembly protein TadD
MAEDQFKRKLTAILSADVVGYSRLMGEDEMATVSTMKSHRSLIAEKIRAFKGRVIDSPGDNILSEFGSIVDALTCAVEIQNELKEKNAELPENRKMVFRIGVNLGDVIEDEDRIYGDGVNIAARIESMADPGGVSISGTAFDSVRNKLRFGFEFLGEHQVKNIAHPVRVYRVLTDPSDAGKLVGAADVDRSIMPKTMLAVAVVVFLLGATYFYLAHTPSKESATTKQTAPQEAGKPSIAVLPFANMSDDPQQEYFSDGMTDDLITDLSKVSGLMVISRNSTFTYKGKPVQIKNVAQDLGVKYVLEGSVRKVGDQIRINAQLIDAEKDHHVWAERYDGQLADVFQLQDQITKKIVSALSANLTAQEGGHRKEPETKNIQAYDAFLKGWNYFLLHTPEDVAKAIPLLKKAIDLDPEYSRAYAALAYVYWRSLDSGWREQLKMSITDARLLASHYLEKALKKPTSTAYAIAAEISDRMLLMEEAVSYAQKAISLAPNDHWAVFIMGHELIKTGKAKEGLAYLRKALELDPHNPGRILQSMSFGEFCLGNYEIAVSHGKRAYELNPAMTSVGCQLAIAYSKLGQQQKAKEAFELYKKGWPKGLQPNIPLVMVLLNYSDPNISKAVVDSLVEAGLPPEPSDYYKPWMLERLTEKDIRKLLLNHTIKGISLYSGKQWWMEIDAVGGFEGRGGSFGKNMNGSLWIEEDLLISIIPEMTKGLKVKGPVFKNKQGSNDKYNEYLWAAAWGSMAFSVVSENDQSSN